MRAHAAGLAERPPRRSRLLDPASHRHGGETVAAAATAAVVGQFLLAPATLAFACVLILTGRVGRWRPHWLAAPALTGLVLLVSRPQAGVQGFLALPRALTDGISTGVGLSRLAHRALSAALVPAQLPVALLAGTAEAGILLWVSMYRPGARPAAGWRRGIIALVRYRFGQIALAAGRTVTQGGCAVGVDPGTGRLATLEWKDFQSGVLASAADPAAVVGLCLPAVAAALRRRMAVVILDLAPAGELTGPVTRLCHALGVAAASLTEVSATSLCGQLLRPECAVGRADSAGLGTLAASLRGLRGLDVRCDALAWVHGCAEAEAEIVATLVSLGPATGVRFLFSTSGDKPAASLTAAVTTALTARPDQGCSLSASLRGSGIAAVRYTAIPLRAVAT